MDVSKKVRLTLDLDIAFRRRVKVMAALKGVSMRQYCQAAIGKELTKDEANGASTRSSNGFSFARLAAGRNEITGDRAFSGDSVQFIRDSRESRNTS